MKNTRKWISVVIMLILVVGMLAACSKGGNNSANGAATGTNGAGSGANSTTDTANSGGDSGADSGAKANAKPEAPYKITIMAPMKKTTIPSDKILKEIDAMTGYDVTFQWVPDGNYEEKLNTSLATGSFPQVVYLKNQDTLPKFKDSIRAGQFWEIGPYLKDFPNLSKLHQEILDNTKVDGKLYTLYEGRDLARQGAIYRKDWMDHLGLKPPTNTTELFNLLKAFTEDDPDGNNKNDTFGLTDRNDLIYGAFKTVASWFHTPNNWGEQDGQLLPEFMFPQYVQTMDWFKQVHDAGYMNKDFPVTSKDDQRNLFFNGKAGVYIGAMSDAKTLQQSTQKNFPDSSVDVFSHVNGPDGKYTTWSIAGYGNVLLFPKSAVKTEDDLKKILGFFDKEMTPDVANLMYWGDEGTHYTLVDGKAKESDDQDLLDTYVTEYRDALIGEHDTNGSYEGYQTIPAMQHAEEQTLDNLKYMINDPAAALDSQTQAEKGVQLQQIIDDATYQYILGNIDKNGFQAAVDKWKTQGGDQVIKEINASYKVSQG